MAFPGPVVKHFDELLSAIESQLCLDTGDIEREQAVARRMFFKYSDASNSRRVKEEVLRRLQA